MLIVVHCFGHVFVSRRWSGWGAPQYQYPEQPSSDQFEQQQEQYEEGKYNMNNLSLLNTISYCILILYAYKDHLSHFISLYMYLGLHFG